jgi:hypothetical protein
VFVNHVVDRHVFYNHSLFDGNNSAAGPQDDLAIAADKRALRPGIGAATLANYTSYSRGINGVMIDVHTRGVVPTLGDFSFRVGNDDNLALWSAGPAPVSISIRQEAGVSGADRITLVWAEGTIRNQWLEVRLTSAAMGLATPDVFYFGNAVAESGNSPSDAIVNATDEVGARNNPKTFVNPAAVTDRYDFNRDGFVNAADQILARISVNVLSPLKLIQPTNGLAVVQQVAGAEGNRHVVALGVTALARAGGLSSANQPSAMPQANVQDQAILLQPFDKTAFDKTALDKTVLTSGPQLTTTFSPAFDRDSLETVLADELLELLATDQLLGNLA